MQGYLIDPAARTITPIQYGGDYREISRFIGCDYFTAVHLDEGDTLYLDDEGLMKGPTHFFKVQGYPEPLAGKAVLLGSDDEGETTSAKQNPENLITFGELLRVGNQIAFLPA